ncbi:MAG: Rne/Rng family ribonuclease [Alphaproteobacteria bacterium]
MIDTIAVNVAFGETRVALIAEGRVIEVFHRRAGGASVAGSVYLGRVARVAPGLQAAFVDIGTGRDGFLNADDARPDADAPTGAIGDYVHEGEAVLVQATRDPVAGKGARLTRRPNLPGRYLVLTPGRAGVTVSRRIDAAAERERLAALVETLAGANDGYVVRTAAAGVEADDIARDAEMLGALWADIEAGRRTATAPACLHDDADPLARALRDHAGPALERVPIDSPDALAEARRFCERFLPAIAGRLEAYREAEPIFERFGVEAALDDALAPGIALPSGGGLVIEETEALVAIDVNTGRSTSGDGPATLLHANLEAAAEIARQLRLRALGGLIVIDFAHMTRAEHRRRVVEALRDALAGDRAANPPRGFTPLGLVEMTRRRSRPTLAETLCDPCSACDGEGRWKSAPSVAFEIARRLMRTAATAPPGRLTVAAAPEVAALLSAAGAGPLAGLEAALGRTLELRESPGRARESYDIIVG